MTTKISGAELRPGMTIKHPSHHRIYFINDIEEPDNIGARLAEVRTTSGEYLTFNLFEDSQYELRSSGGHPRVRTVKVRAADLEQLLRVASYDVHVPATGQAVARLREAMIS